MVFRGHILSHVVARYYLVTGNNAFPLFPLLFFAVSVCFYHIEQCWHECSWTHTLTQRWCHCCGDSYLDEKVCASFIQVNVCLLSKTVVTSHASTMNTQEHSFHHFSARDHFYHTVIFADVENVNLSALFISLAFP